MAAQTRFCVNSVIGEMMLSAHGASTTRAITPDNPGAAAIQFSLNAGIDMVRDPSRGCSDLIPWDAGRRSVLKTASLLLVGVAWLRACGGLGVRRSQRPAMTRHRFFCLAACVAIGTLLGTSQTAPAAEEDLLNDPLYFSGATLHIRPYVALPSGFNDIIGMTHRPDDTRMYVTTSEGTIFAINDNGAGTTSAVPWFNASAALQAATGRSMNGNYGPEGPAIGRVSPGFWQCWNARLWQAVHDDARKPTGQPR